MNFFYKPYPRASLLLSQLNQKFENSIKVKQLVIKNLFAIFLLKSKCIDLKNQSTSTSRKSFRLRDVEPQQCETRTTREDICLHVCRTCNETFTHQQSLLPIPFPWKQDVLTFESSRMTVSLKISNRVPINRSPL